MNTGLKNTAKASVLWSGGATLVKDIIQFGSMLILVRLLSPTEYGAVALAQVIMGMLSIISYNTFSAHALQLSDPSEIDWNSHLTAGLFLNSFLFIITLIIATGLSYTEKYHEVALALMILSSVFLVEIGSTLRQRMLETAHEWKRLRTLTIVGALIGSIAGITIAAMGGGVAALAVQMPLSGAPMLLDYIFTSHRKHKLAWSWAGYKETVQFGLRRMGVAFAHNGRRFVEQSMLSATYGLVTVGLYSRALGLSQLLAGRVGEFVMLPLYPVITRAADEHERYKRVVDLVFRAVCWVTIPATIFLAYEASDIVSLLYGEKWMSVIPLIPAAALSIGLGGLSLTASRLLMASGEVKICTRIDITAALIGIGGTLALLPIGVVTYLWGLVAIGGILLLVYVVVLLRMERASYAGMRDAMFPPLASSMISMLLVTYTNIDGYELSILVRLLLLGIVFLVVYLVSLYLLFSRSLRELLDLAI